MYCCLPGLSALFHDINMGAPNYSPDVIFSILYLYIFLFTVVEISNPYNKYGLARNPLFKPDVKFQKLSDFLALAKNASTLSGVLLGIEVSFVAFGHRTC